MPGMRIVAVFGLSLALQDGVLFEEKFAEKPGAGWEWVREDAGAWKVEGGALSIKVQPGTLWYKTDTAKNLLLRRLPADPDVAVEVEVASKPAQNAEQAGLHWYVDDGNYVKLVRQMVKGEVVVVLSREEDGIPVEIKRVPHNEEETHLRLSRSGGKITGQVRGFDADEWRTVGSCDPPGKGEPRVGLAAYGGVEKGDRTARFTKFRLLKVAK